MVFGRYENSIDLAPPHRCVEMPRPASGPETARLALFDCSIDKHDCEQHVGSLGSEILRGHRRSTRHIQKQTRHRQTACSGRVCACHIGTPNRLRHLTTQHRLKTSSQQLWSFRVQDLSTRPLHPAAPLPRLVSYRFHEARPPARPSSRRRLVRARWSCARMLPPRGPMPATSKCTVRAHSASSQCELKACAR